LCQIDIQETRRGYECNGYQKSAKVARHSSGQPDADREQRQSPWVDDCGQEGKDDEGLFVQLVENLKRLNVTGGDKGPDRRDAEAPEASERREDRDWLSIRRLPRWRHWCGTTTNVGPEAAIQAG